MPLVSYEDDDSIDLFLRQQERSDRALQRQQKAEERASVQQEVTDLEESESESGDFVTGVKAGFTQTQGLGGGVKALAGSVLGNEDWVRDGLDYYNQKMSEADALGGNVTRVEDIESFGDSLDYMQYTLGTLVPDLLGGGLAGIATKAAVKGAAKNVLKESIDARVQQAVTDGAAEAGNKIALKKLRKDYEQEALGKIPQRAAIGGSALYSIGMNAGENFTEIEAETGKLDPVAALTVGVAQGALDSVGVPMRAFKKLFPDRSPEGLRTAIAEQLNDNRGVVRRIITESAKTAGAEGGIEALQEVMGRAAVAWANESLPESEQQEFFEIMAGENAQSLYINSLAAGFIGGGVIGGTVEGVRPKFDPADYDDRLGKMVEAKRAAKNAAAETDNTPPEETIELGDMPLEPEENTIYLGSLPGPLQKQLLADGVEDDIAPIETVQASIEKLDGIEQQRAKSSLEKQGIASRRRRKVQPEKEPGAVAFEGPIFTVSTPQSLKEKQTELEQQAKEGSEKIQVNGDDTFVPESISFSSLLKTITPARGGDPLINNRDEAEDPITLQSLVDHYDNPRNPLDVPELEETMSIYLDLVDRGVPRQHIESVTGTYAIEGNVDLPDDAVAAYFPQSGAVGINTEQLTEGLSSDEAARVNRFAMAHEVWHSADSEQSYSDTLPDFAMEFADVDGDGLPDMLLGDVVDELYGNWENGTDLGRRFGYPFNYLEAMLNDAAPEDRPAILRATQREVFAQLGAMLTANPKLLKQNAPKAYNLIKSLRDNPTLTAEDITSEQTQDQTDNPSTDATAVPGQVRAPPITGSAEVQVDGGAERVGGDGLETGQADQELGEQTQPDDGDAAGRVLRQQVIDFVASQGEVSGVSPIQNNLRKGYNPTVELIDELVADGELQENLAADGSVSYTVPQQAETPDPIRVPEAEERAPVLPMGKVEESLQSLLAETENNPTREQLETIVGSPKPRKGKEELDKNVEPRTLEELRQYMREAQQESKGLQWYDQFGRFFRDLVGDANLDEASIVFGVTSQQNSAEQNLADTLHVMSVARKTDPTNAKQFELALRNTRRPGGQKLKITGDQIKRITEMYQKGALEGGIKVTTYMQMVQDRGRNLFNPFSVQDVHMSRVFGFNYRDVDKKSGEVVDAAKFNGENQYRYGQYLTSILADEFNVTPNQAQALLWFYAKQNLSPAKAGKPGTFESAFDLSQPEIEVIKQMVASGEFDTSKALTPALEGGVRPENKPDSKVEANQFSTVRQRGELIDLARERAPKIIASAIPGVDRGFAFPEDTPIETLVEYNNAIVEAITDSEGQIPMLREMGLPHEISTGSGSFTGYEPSISVRLLGGTLEQAAQIGPVLGDALLQDAVITAQPIYSDEGMPAFIVEKVDKSDFSTEDGIALTERLNPNKDPGGINFNQPLSNGLVFIDPKVFGSEAYSEDDALAFYDTLSSALGADYSIEAISQNGDYFEHTEYGQAVEALRNQEGLAGSSNLQNITRSTLYEPAQRVYEEYAEKLGVERQVETPEFIRVPSYKSGLARDVARNQAVKDLENSGIGYDDLIGDFDIDDLTVSPEFKRLLKALERDDYLGFDRIDDLMIQLFEDEDGLTNFDASPGLKSAFGRYLNDVNGFTAEDVQYIRVDEPYQEDVSFNLNDDFSVDKSLDSRLRKIMPKSVTRKLSDRLERLKELERRFAEVLGLDRLPSAFSAYDSENLMHSKAQKQLEDFEEDHVKPIAELIKDADVELEQVGLYLLAKHAPERNAKIAQQERDLRQQQIETLENQMETAEEESDLNLIKKKLDVLKSAPFKYQEKGSGLTDAEAEAIIELAEQEGRSEALEGIASRVYQMLTDMRNNMVEQGLLDNRTRNDWEDTYQFYVPLKGFAAFPEGLEMKGGSGTQGFSIKGSESFKAKGRVTLPVNPLTVSLKDAEEKIVRAEKNRAAQKLLKMFEKFQSSDNWRVYNQKVRPPRDDNPSEMKSNQELRSERRADDGLPRYIEVKRRGKSFFIEVRDQELNRQLQSGGVGMFNNQVDFMNRALTNMQKFQNFRRNMLINYNPSWGLVNPLRDIQTGLAFAISELDAKGGRLAGKFEGATDLVGKVSKSYMPSLKAFYRARRGSEGKTAEAREYDQYAKEYIEDGAPTGLSVAKSLEEQQARFETIMGQTMKAKGINKLRPMFDWVEDANQTTENAARLATYIEARKAGVDRADAATLAKDLTVNFNRKGEYSSAIDSLYLFFNAAVQGNVNIIKALTRGKKDGGVSKAQTLAASMVMFGFARTLANISFAGEDDDGESNYVDYNEYVMKTAMVFTDGRQGYAMPMPYGYGLLDNIGRFGAEMVMGIKTPEQVSVDLATSIDHHFNPMSLHATGDDRDLIESAILKGMFFLSPDIGDMAIEQIANINFFGSNVTIPQNPLMVERPAAYASKRGTNEGVTAVTEFLNDISGGSEYRSGAIDLNPERIMHFYEFLMGGVGRFLDDSSDTVMKMATEEPDLLPKDVPILRTFMPMASEYSDRVTFYSNRGDYQQYRVEYKESTPQERRNLQQRFGPRLYQFEVTHKAIEKQLRDLRKEKKALYDDKVIDSMVRWKRLQAIAEKEERLYDEYNKRFESVRP